MVTTTDTGYIYGLDKVTTTDTKILQKNKQP